MGDYKAIAGKRNEEKKALYKTLIENLIKSKDRPQLTTVVEHLIQTEGTQQYGRTYITTDCLVHLTNVMMDENTDPWELKDLIPFTQRCVDLLRERGEDFPDALMKMIRLLAEAHQGEGDYRKAASALSSFKFDAYRTCTATAEDKVTWYVTTAEFYLAVQDSGFASQVIKRAHALVNDIKSNQELTVRFRTQYARVLDCDRKFFEASMRYKELAQTGAGFMTEADLMQVLGNAVTCAILAPAGPSRARLLALLYADDRTKSLPFFGLLEKMFKEQIIRPAEVEKFENTLQEHQKAMTGPAGKQKTVLQNSMIEHNMLAASKIYNNIKFDQLGGLLGISPKMAEELASTMIEQGRMSGTIDQIEALVEFDDGAGAGTLATWDGQIQDACLMVNVILENIAKKHPQYKY